MYAAYRLQWRYLAEGNVRVADLLWQVFAIDAVEPMSWVNAVHATHSSNTADEVASLICTMHRHHHHHQWYSIPIWESDKFVFGGWIIRFVHVGLVICIYADVILVKVSFLTYRYQLLHCMHAKATYFLTDMFTYLHCVSIKTCQRFFASVSVKYKLISLKICRHALK